MLKLDLARDAKKFLDKLPPKQFRQIVVKIFGLLTDPSSSDSEQLRGYSFRRVDVGEYRVVYQEENGCLKVYCIGKRNDSEVYKKLSRQ